VLKMLTARTGHILHPEYLQPLPSTPVSPIEVRTLSQGQGGTTHPGYPLRVSFSWDPGVGVEAGVSE
jgi:hypothetical protein